MKSIARYLATILPALITLSLWPSGVMIFKYFDCRFSAKFIGSCFAYGYKIQGWLGLSMFWAQLAFYLSLPICAWLLIKALACKDLRHETQQFIRANL